MKYTDKIKKENELENTFYYSDNRSQRIEELQEEVGRLKKELISIEAERDQLRLVKKDRDNLLKKLSHFEGLFTKSVDLEWYVHDFSGLNPDENPLPSDVVISCTDPDHITVCVMGKGITGTYEEALENAKHIVEVHNHMKKEVL